MVSSATTIAVDCMGGDNGPVVPVRAAIKALENIPSLHIILVGKQERVLPLAESGQAKFGQRLQFVPALDEIAMNDKVAVALRSKKNSSMKIALELVAQGQADGVVSCGNTGALMALARFVLKMLPGVDRPAIIAPLPSIHGQTYVLDLGANVNSDSETLFQFGVMGSVMYQVIHKKRAPKVALLNVGEEDIKGNDQVKRAAELLKQNTMINYCGFVEGDQIYLGTADVVVCDGFVGNSLLKASEGLSEFLYSLLLKEYRNSFLGRVLLWLSQPVLAKVRKASNPDHYNGASLIGINGSVVKSHGRSNEAAFLHAIESAFSEAENHLPEKIKNELDRVLINGVCL